MTEYLVLFGYCAIIVGVSVLGGLVPLTTVMTHRRLQLYLSFAAGVMFGAAMLHMLAEAVAIIEPDAALLLATAGFLGLFFTERFFASHRHDDAIADEHHKLTWPAVIIGLFIHTLANGVALASAVAVHDPDEGALALSLGVFVAVALHKPADSLTIVTLMLAGGARRAKAHLVNGLFAMIVPLGVLLFFFARNLVEQGVHGEFAGAVLAVSAGMFLCIALSDLLPELHFHEHDRLQLSGMLVAGVAFMLVVGWIEPEHHHGHPEHIHEAQDSPHDHDAHDHPDHKHEDGHAAPVTTKSADAHEHGANNQRLPDSVADNSSAKPAGSRSVAGCGNSRNSRSSSATSDCVTRSLNRARVANPHCGRC